MRFALRPRSESKKLLHVRRGESHHDSVGPRAEFVVGKAMIAMTVRMRHEQAKFASGFLFFPIANQFVHRRHDGPRPAFARFRAGVQQQRATLAQQQIAKRRLEVDALVLAQNERPRPRFVHLQRLARWLPRRDAMNP